MAVVAVDQGTTATKALLIEDDGSSRLIASIKHEQILPRPGWVEHDASELLANVREAIALGVAAGATSIALDNQGETVVAWDKDDGIPLCNAIVWQDQRTEAAIETLRGDGHGPEVTARSGLPLDAYFSASKLRWILDTVPRARELARTGRLGLGTSDSYFLHQLTGRYVTDVTTAARTSLMTLDTCAWDERLGALFGVPLDLLPAIVECDQPVGEMPADGRSAPIDAAIVDQVASLYGHGCRKPGDLKATFGTGAFALMIADGRPAVPGTVSTVGWGGPAHRTHAVDGGVYTAGAAIEWLGRIGLLSDVAELDALPAGTAVEKGVCFVPALAGLACPHWDRTASGLWIGLDSGTGREDMIKAVLEGVAFRMVEVLEALSAGGEPQGLLSVDGGLTRSRYFLQFFASVAGRPVVVPANPELTAYGAGLLAARGRIPASLGSRITVEPESHDVAPWRERFTEARVRSSGWRRSETSP
jgi:glycerol kinase